MEGKFRFQTWQGKTHEVAQIAVPNAVVGHTQIGPVYGGLHAPRGGRAGEGAEAELARASEAGSISLEAFIGHGLLFDYGQRTLTIYDAGEAPQLAQSLPLEIGPQESFVILKSGGKTLRFVLDTAVPVNLVDREKLACGDNCGRPRLRALSDANGKALLEQDAEVTSLKGAPFDGVLGAPFFRSYRVLFDMAAQTLQVSPAAQ